MMKRSLLLVGVIGLAAFTAACGGSAERKKPSTTTTTVTSATTTTTGASRSAACQANPDPANSTQVVVNQPAANDLVTSPLAVSGSINAFEATFEIAIKDASGNDIATATGQSAQGQTLAAFSESVPFTVSAPTPACLWVFQFSAQDGSPSMVLQVEITLNP
ncbi:MAG: hypothetical protein EXQ79_00855 [Acidimicrobiia bacterium]|nr:hypothetical protein [Acidimicrobiia bacterium]